jgi:hypothetical protein
MNGIVLNMPTQTKPKEESHNYRGQRYMLRFDPHASENQQWTWTVSYTIVYPYYGSASSLPNAKRAAERKIRTLVGQNERWSE